MKGFFLLRGCSLAIPALGLLFFSGIALKSVHATDLIIVGSDDADSIHFESDANTSSDPGCYFDIEGLLTFSPDSTYDNDAGILQVHSAEASATIEPNDQPAGDVTAADLQCQQVGLVLESISGLPDVLEYGNPVHCQIQGDFTVRDSTFEVSTPAEVRLISRDENTGEQELEVFADFQLLPDSYGGSIADAQFPDQAKWINIHVHLAASSAYAPYSFDEED